MAFPEGYDPQFWPVPQPDSGAERDLSEDTRQTLADYLKAITSGDAPNVASANAYPMSNTQVETPLTSDAGQPASFETGGPGGMDQAKFMDVESPNATALFDQNSNSGMFDSVAPTSETLSTFLDKNSQTHGNDLLASVVGTPINTRGASSIPTPSAATVVQKKISNVLKTNRFSNSMDTPYIEDGEFSNTKIPEQGEYGVYKTEDSNTDIDDLFKVGLSMIFQATGHSPMDPTSPLAALEAIVPSPAQLLVMKVGSSRMSAIEAHGAPEVTRLVSSDLLIDINGDPVTEQKSYGQLNSHLEPFAGFYPAGMVALSITSMITLLGAAALYNVLIQAIRTPGALPSVAIPGAGGSGGANASNPSSLPMGSSVHETFKQRLLLAFGIPRTKFPFELCMVKGILAFYGLPINVGNPDTIGGLLLSQALPTAWSTADNIYSAAGFYVGIIRNALRDVLNLPQIAAAWGGSVLIPAQGIVYVIGEITRSSTWRFLMTMAQIGNAVLMSNRRTFGTTSPINLIPDNPATKIAKSRVSPLTTTPGGPDRLVWRHSNNSSRYLIPKSFHTAGIQFGDEGSQKAAEAGTYGWLRGKLISAGAKAPLDANKPELSAIQAMSGMRISKEYVEFIENELELEYMPFYFHDLRTNEVIAFNAFIDSIKDSFSVDYTSTNGYGRIDPVMIYNKTTRKISLTFVLAATSPEDFDAMWFDINKLTTLIYPQWSRGKPVQAAGGDRFIMPFSQIPTASPMIRLRLGDVVRGNYSKFSLARLFGAGIPATPDGDYNIGELGESESWSVDGESYSSIDEAAAAQTAAVDSEATLRQTDPGGDIDSEFGHQIGDMAYLLEAPPAGHYCVDEADAPPNVNLCTHVFPMRNTTKGQVTILDRQADINGNINWINYIVEFTSLGYPVDPYTPDHKHIMTVYHGNLEIDASDISFPISHEDSTSVSTSHEFYDNENNAVVRSFRSTMGRGLAGFIDAFDIDYGDYTWETALGSRAPQMVKISIGFAPIHDIPPGIDADGFNRAPIYNVGRIMNGISGDQWGNDLLDPGDPLVMKYLEAKAAIHAPAGTEAEPGGPPETTGTS